MLKNITYLFPKKSGDFFTFLKSILEKLPNSVIKDDGISIIPRNPPNAYPITSFLMGDVSYPQFVLEIPQNIYIQSGQFEIKNKNNSTHSEVILSLAQEIDSKKLNIRDLYERLQGHIVRIDHTGVNLPTISIKESEWANFIKQLSLESNTYNYPRVESWKFIIPATEEEHLTDITEFPFGREPKFELVYDAYTKIPCIQIDIQTDLTRDDAEKLFPDPYGISFPDLADIFRTVYIAHEWKGLSIRFDLRFKHTVGEDDWQTGKWLVRDGGRSK
jgi:hypothetical protein